MSSDEGLMLPVDLEKSLDKPYRGLFGASVHAKVVEEIAADPYHDFRPKDIHEMTGCDRKSIRKALETLSRLDMVRNVSSDARRPLYRANQNSKTLTALTFLAYASIDDRDSSDCMDQAIVHYCHEVIPEKSEPSAAGAFRVIDYDSYSVVQTATILPKKTADDRYRQVA